MSTLKTALFNNAKNILGWKTNRKIVVISVDDYGNVRVDSKQARENMDAAGLTARTRFDKYDSLENEQDLEALYDALTSVKDKNGRHAVFTPFAIPCNINFEKMADEGYERYHYELLTETYNKLSGYDGTWQLWQEGINAGIMVPQFHGRGHLNLKVFKEKLHRKDTQLMAALKNRSFVSLPSTGYSTISTTAAFEFWDFKENEAFTEIIKDGLNAFEKVFGYRSDHFNSPGGREHPIIHKVLKDNGIKYIDTPFIKTEHQGEGKYKKILNFTGKTNNIGQVFEVRNVVFEPTEAKNFDWVDYSFKQVETAFRWNRPAIISSHRVNFCGHIDEANRRTGITALKSLLQKIVSKWPEVEFMAGNELGELISKSIKHL